MMLYGEQSRYDCGDFVSIKYLINELIRKRMRKFMNFSKEGNCTGIKIIYYNLLFIISQSDLHPFKNNFLEHRYIVLFSQSLVPFYTFCLERKVYHMLRSNLKHIEGANGDPTYA